MKQQIARFIDIWARKAMDGASRALCGPTEFEFQAKAPPPTPQPCETTFHSSAYYHRRTVCNDGKTLRTDVLARDGQIVSQRDNHNDR